MELAWTDPAIAHQYAFGQPCGPLARRVVLLHKNRLPEIEAKLVDAILFQGRWQGLKTADEQIAFIPVPGGIADVSDCLLHLAAYPPQEAVFTGTCGAISPEVEIGGLYLVKEGWLPMEGILQWLNDPRQIVETAQSVQPTKIIDSTRLVEKLEIQFQLQPQWASSFSVPFQAMESPSFLRSVQQLGARIIDMESAIFLALANQLKIPSLCLLWCTDNPETHSYYVKPEEALQKKRQEMWVLWPEIIIAGFAL